MGSRTNARAARHGVLASASRGVVPLVGMSSVMSVIYTSDDGILPGGTICRTLPAASSHSSQHEEMRDLTPSRSLTNPDQISNAQKCQERELKNWEKPLKHRATELGDVRKQLSASRVAIDRYEYEMALSRVKCHSEHTS